MAKKSLKKWYLSRTLWLAVLQAVAGIIAVMITEFDVPGFVLVGKSLLDAVLRFDTKEELK